MLKHRVSQEPKITYFPLVFMALVRGLLPELEAKSILVPTRIINLMPVVSKF